MGKDANKIKKEVLSYLTMRGHFISPINNAPSRHHKNTVVKGFPDMAGCLGRDVKINDKKYISGVGLFIEIKTESDRQSEHQKKIGIEITERGAIYLIVGSLEDLQEAGF